MSQQPAKSSDAAKHSSSEFHRCLHYEIGASMEGFLRGSRNAGRYLHEFECDVAVFDRVHSANKLDQMQSDMDAFLNKKRRPPPAPSKSLSRMLTAISVNDGEREREDGEVEDDEGNKPQAPAVENDKSAGQLGSETEEGEITDREQSPASSESELEAELTTKRQKTGHQTEARLATHAVRAVHGGSRKTRRKPAQKKKDRQRSSYWLVASSGDARLAKMTKLCFRSLVRCKAYMAHGFSMPEHAVMAKSRWQGVSWPRDDIDKLKKIWETPGEMGKVVKYFLPIPYNGQPAMLLDHEGRCFAYRTAQVPFILDNEVELHKDIYDLMGPTLALPTARAYHAKGRRGPHFPCITGHHRQYLQEPSENEWQTNPLNKEHFKKFRESEIIQRITSYVSKTVEIIFPGVAKRFEESKAWYKEVHQIEPMFGLFWNLCVNGLWDPRDRIHCAPHADWKNILGVCVLVVYQDPTKPFDHKLLSWLVLWEAGVVIELPPGVILIYPSSLLHHFNVDVHDFQFVMTRGERPTKTNSTPIVPGNKEGRGTLVYFNQASMYQLSELGSTVGETRAKLSGRKDMTAEEKQEAVRAHPATLQEAFNDQNYKVLMQSSPRS